MNDLPDSDARADEADFHRWIEAVVDALPQQMQHAARQVGVQVADMPPRALLADLGFDDPMELTGLYEGIPLTEKTSLEQVMAPDVIWLFRQPILAEWRERRGVTLEALVRHVYIHELAHHFGWSDNDIAEIDRWWE